MKLDYTDLLGKEFQYGGRGPEAYDCYGLAAEICRRAGRILPAWESVAGSALIDSEISRAKPLFRELPGPEPFCLVTFMIRPPFTSHIGAVLEDRRRFIHIARKLRVCVERLDDPAWSRRITGYFEPLAL